MGEFPNEYMRTSLQVFVFPLKWVLIFPPNSLPQRLTKALNQGRIIISSTWDSPGIPVFLFFCVSSWPELKYYLPSSRTHVQSTRLSPSRAVFLWISFLSFKHILPFHFNWLPSWLMLPFTWGYLPEGFFFSFFLFYLGFLCWSHGRILLVCLAFHPAENNLQIEFTWKKKILSVQQLLTVLSCFPWCMISFWESPSGCRRCRHCHLTTSCPGPVGFASLLMISLLSFILSVIEEDFKVLR